MRKIKRAPQQMTLIEVPIDDNDLNAERAEPYKTRLIIKIDNKDFIEKLKDSAYEEIEVAKKKWGVTDKEISKDIEKEIISISLLQLQDKVNSIFYDTDKEWILGKELDFYIENYLPISKILIKDDKADSVRSKRMRDSYLYRHKNGYFTIAKEENNDFPDSSPLIIDSYEYIQELFSTWLKTAVFYGVGSYA